MPNSFRTLFGMVTRPLDVTIAVGISQNPSPQRLRGHREYLCDLSVSVVSLLLGNLTHGNCNLIPLSAAGERHTRMVSGSPRPFPRGCLPVAAPHFPASGTPA